MMQRGQTGNRDVPIDDAASSPMDENVLLREKRQSVQGSRGIEKDCMRLIHLGDELDDTAGLLDLLLGKRRDPAGLDDAGKSGETALAENLAVTGSERVDDGDLGGRGGEALALLSGDESPELVKVDNGAEARVAGQVEVAHTDLTEVTYWSGMMNRSCEEQECQCESPRRFTS